MRKNLWRIGAIVAFAALLATPVLAAVWVVVASVYRSFRGESADEILASHRSSWIRRRSNQSYFKIRKGGLAAAKTGEDNTAVEHPNGGSPISAGVMQQQEKGNSTPGKVEHMDLLRPVPRREEITSTGSGRLTEYGEED